MSDEAGAMAGGALQNPAPRVYAPGEGGEAEALEDEEMQELREWVFDTIRTVRDPEHPYSLEELKVVTEEAVYVRRDDDGTEYVRVVFTPTVPHCSLSTLIGLCIRHKLSAEMPGAKIEVFVKPGSHMTADEITKQVNDKERVTAAMENPPLRDTVVRLTRPDPEAHR